MNSQLQEGAKQVIFRKKGITGRFKIVQKSKGGNEFDVFKEHKYQKSKRTMSKGDKDSKRWSKKVTPGPNQ